MIQTYITARSKTDFGYKQLLEKTGAWIRVARLEGYFANPNDAILEEIDTLSSKIVKMQISLSFVELEVPISVRKQS